ncbi:VOC family protein [Bacillus mesophilus]|nr:VOC family protein [Bacillus mesophilus]
MHHIGLYTNNLSETESFYETMFGFRLDRRIQIFGEIITFMKHEEICIELLKSDSIDFNGESIHFAWSVESLKDTMKELEKKGLNPIEGPYHLKNGWKTAFYQGPTHEIIELIES